MTTLFFVRFFFFLLSAVVGYYIGDLGNSAIPGVLLGALFSLVLIFLEQRMHRVSVRGLSSMVFGLLLGLFMANLISGILSLLPLDTVIQSTLRVILTLVFSYLGAIMALRGKDEFNVIIPYMRFKRYDVKEGIVILDSSAIIDGRISDIYKINFLTGRLIVPRFILQELQKLADSSDDNKRQRGRRGLEILRIMQNDPKMDVHIHEDDLTETETDARLVKLAKIMEARVCTTDFNLGQTAALQGVEVLNIHELVHAVKSLVFTGERLEVKLIREGKEQNQAVGYLDDGTMVVVPDGKHLIGQNVSVTVTSVLQTQAGRMIFAKIEK